MPTNNRLDQIVNLVEERGFLSVGDLSQILDVSEMTIRRDLNRLDSEKRILRTYGGAAPLRTAEMQLSGEGALAGANPEPPQFDQVDVLIATSVNPYYDNLLLDRVDKRNIPIIAESVNMPNQRTLVAVNNYQASFDLGCWAGQFMKSKGAEKIHLLDLNYHLKNTLTRSQGFIAGLRQVDSSFELVLSINCQSRYTTAYQLTRDALTVHPHINLIFAINDITAWAAIQACQDMNIDPNKMTVVTFGLEGDTLKNALVENSYCKAGLAMFPEIVSQVCIEAAITAYNQQPLLEEYVTPHVVLTADNIGDYYVQSANGWKLNWETIYSSLKLPIRLDREALRKLPQRPQRIGLIIPFSEHEWYKNLNLHLKENTAQYGIELQIIDAEQSVRDEVELRRRAIAARAASMVNPGDVILVDNGPIALYLARELKQKQDITVITNSLVVFNTLNPTPGIILISTGGAVRYSSQTLVGPTAESALKELRADKLFLMGSGITLNFGLSHTNISEVTIKQAMLRSAREVILLADHTSFGTESVIQIAPLNLINTLITDDAMQPSMRLDISKLGIQIILV
jgi:DeoR/GlpR family transcriptional regulator of sugar metabolism